MMRLPSFVIALGLGSLTLSGLGIAQQTTAPTQSSTAVAPITTQSVLIIAQTDSENKTAPKSQTKEDSPRLPNQYGKLELSGDQKDQVYTIQKKYESQIEALEKQLAELKSKREGELKAVLTDAQKTKLQEILNAPKTKKTKTATSTEKP